MYKQYAPVGKCIYCGEINNALSNEHIIPYALGGSLVLPRASCARHRNLTSVIERRVAQEMYGTYRDVQGVQTRHRKREEQRRNGTVVMNGTTFDDQPCEVRVPIRELPGVHISIHLPVPQVLSGRPLTVGSLGSHVKAQSDPTILQRLLTKYNLKTISAEAHIQVETFLRVIAKIAHAFAVAEYGIEGFSPMLLPIINGESDHLIQYVGSETPEQAQSVEPLSISELVHNGVVYLSVFISLHSFPQLPRYQVIAGTTNV
jgi:hypothetical protein